MNKEHHGYTQEDIDEQIKEGLIVYNDEFYYRDVIISWAERKELGIENMTFKNFKKLIDLIL